MRARRSPADLPRRQRPSSARWRWMELVDVASARARAVVGWAGEDRDSRAVVPAVAVPRTYRKERAAVSARRALAPQAGAAWRRRARDFPRQYTAAMYGLR